MDREREHKGAARALGIEAFNNGCAPLSIFTNQDLLNMCVGRNSAMIKALVVAFINGWQVQASVCGKGPYA